jgi:hypothetical protein
MPCATPHSAPSRWLAGPAQEPHVLSQDEGLTAHDLTAHDLTALADRLRSDPDALAEFIERVSPPQERGDGWSPFARKVFLQTIADTGKVTLAADCSGMSRQSAYALATRDPLFAAAWDAAALMARRPMDDTAREQVIDGITETITRSDGATVTRHRYDVRLTLGLLNRLDKRCDRAEERGGAHLALIQRWDEVLALIGKGEDEAARALIEPASEQNAKLCQNCQFPESENPIEEDGDEDGIDLSHRFWRDGIDELWMTDFPPPAGFTGYQSRDYDDVEDEERYVRACTEEEVAILEADEKRERAAERDEWLAMLKSEAEDSGSAEEGVAAIEQ